MCGTSCSKVAASSRFIIVSVPLLLGIGSVALAGQPAPAGVDGQPITLRAWGVPNKFDIGIDKTIERIIVEEFCRRYPWIHPVSTEGLQLPGKTMDMVPFMQIAGDIPPHVLYVNFRQSQTYIDMKLLYPLDKYVEQAAGVQLADGPTMSNEQYVQALSKGQGWAQIEDRVLPQCWEVMRRKCPYPQQGRACPYCKAWGLSDQIASRPHRHVWCFPIGPLVMGVQYNRTLFAEHAADGIEQRAPHTWDEMLRWAKILTNPPANEFGLNMNPQSKGWYFLTFLYSAGGRVVEKTPDEQWYCVLDSEEAAEAAYFFARLCLEKVHRNGRVYRGVISTATGVSGTGEIRYGMQFQYLDQRFIRTAGDQNAGFGPVPVGPSGLRGSEFNSRMMGIFSGLAYNQRLRDAAWKYIWFYDGPEARRIRTEQMVQAGLGHYVEPSLLKAYNVGGRYDDILRSMPKDVAETYRIAFQYGVPEPYGKNCQYVYDQIAKPLGVITDNSSSNPVRAAIDNNDPEAGKAAIRKILKQATEQINKKMLGHLGPEEQRRRELVAWIVVVAVVVIFVFVLRRVFRVFTPPEMVARGGWQFRRFRMAYVLVAPAILSIAVWMYWPVLKGTVIAFQDYSVLGESAFVGMKNFADVLYDNEFWHSLRVSLVYALLFMIFGFTAPIALAFLLQEVPRGKVLFRTIYYLPAVLTGLVVILLWKSFYGPEGMINQVINSFIFVINGLLHSWLPLLEQPISEVHQNWLESRSMALFFCLLPTVWAGMGPGCLIYLAALKTVPEEIYEAADIDGAGIKAKVFYVAIPSIRALVMINFIGAAIGAIRGAGGFILAMTGGGPYGMEGGATEVIGLKLFYTAFGYLKFGTACAMAWVLGAMLIGFTVVQLQRLSRLEFRTAEQVA